ncbi:MAG: c-type cytochrome [Planctomycetes bacterium]|nr:c-type cytochrome [Planctomycetota bacterium]
MASHHRRRFGIAVAVWCAATLALSFTPSSPGSAPLQGARQRGAKVTFERVQPGGKKQSHSRRSRLLSLAVERGEVPTPFLELGYFKATYRAVVTVPSRDRYRFRIAGRGKVAFQLNGKPVLSGALRAKQPLETAKSVRLDKGDNDLELEFESTAFGDGQLRLFWAPPDCGFEPIPPQLLSWTTDDPEIAAGDRLERGLLLFGERRCARCHDFEVRRYGESAFGQIAAGAPDLRTAGARLRPEWVAAWLRDPTRFRSDASMPDLQLGDKDVMDVAAWLGELGTPLPMEFEAAAATAGKARFLQLGCIACHVPPDRAPGEAALGDRIRLHHVQQKWHAAALVAYLENPGSLYEHVRMPDLKLSRNEATELAAYLLNTPSAVQVEPLPRVKGDAVRGRRVAQDKLCAACHELDVPIDDEVAPDVPNLKAQRGCLADSAQGRGRAPDHRLSDDDRAALRAFLPLASEVPFRISPLDYAERQLETQRCTACHGIDDRPSVWAQVAGELAKDDPLPVEQDPVAQGVPSLTWVGAKLQPSWIAGFVTGEIASPRPWLHARMPKFALRGRAIAEGLVRQHGYAGDEPATAANAQMAIEGEKLIKTGTGFGCVQCHALGDKKAEQVFEREGIELYTARQRLRHEYYSRWLLDPPRIDPESRMPKFANSKGQTAFTEILGGDAEKQFEAIWQFLGSRR